MGFLTFRGGIHPDDGKALSKEKPITAIQAGPVLYYSTSQHIGAPAKPVVSKGGPCPPRTDDRRGGRICICAGACDRIGNRKGN